MAEEYRTYVGPSANYDFIGAAQFALLCALGLREQHTLLDYGCGSLRAGRLFMPYLRPQKYYGLEPNAWLVQEALELECGHDIIRAKQPTFAHNEDFAVPFDLEFDFILAQSIFTHTGLALMDKAMRGMAAALAPRGLLAATFFISAVDDPREGWIYFDTVPEGQFPGTAFSEETIAACAAACGLACCRISWFHPSGQKWFIFAKDAGLLPDAEQQKLLTGINVLAPR